MPIFRQLPVIVDDDKACAPWAGGAPQGHLP
jgi:hypothetical protein